MLEKGVRVDATQLAMMGFTPCSDADLRTKVEHENNEMTVLQYGETNHVFQKDGEHHFIYVEEIE